MKFLCEQCKAKYQISDDKVAGKTVRMTCRKCGHNIEVRAEVTETSVAKGLPAPDGAKPPVPGAPRPPQKPAPPRAGLATSLATAPRRGEPPKPPGALAGAFQSTVKKDDSALDLLSLSASSEWYVAINGVPVGPVRGSELRRKAAQGSVTDDSLVWQEGMDEWRPVRAVAELAALVREAASSGRPSLISPAPGEVRASVPPPAPTGSPPARPTRPSGIPPRPPMRSSEPAAARSNVVAFTGPRLATAEKIEVEEDDAQLTEVQVVPQLDAVPARSSLVAPDPFAMPPPAPAVATPPPAVLAPILTPPPGMAPSSPFATPNPLGSPLSAPAPFAPAEPAQKKAPPWIPIAMIGAAMTFGLVGGFAYFFRQPQQPPQVVIQMPSATATAAPVAPPPSASVDTNPAPTDSVASAAPEKPGTPRATGVAKPASTGNGKPVDPSIAALLQGGGSGPTAGPTGGGGGGGGGSSLSSDAIEGVVRSHSAGVKRTCWERGGSQASSVNVTCRVVIAGNGQVSSASANGSDPVVTKCIESSVRSWSFPASGGTTTVDIPFHFVRQ